MAWNIVPQVEKVGKEEVLVDVKHVKFFPNKDGRGNVDGFGTLGFVCLRVIIRDDRGTQLRLTLHTAGGDYLNPGFTITHPDRIGKPLIVVGAGKNRRRIHDMTAADVLVTGEKEKYPYQQDFENRLRKLTGDALADDIMRKFLARFLNIVSKQTAAK